MPGAALSAVPSYRDITSCSFSFDFPKIRIRKSHASTGILIPHSRGPSPKSRELFLGKMKRIISPGPVRQTQPAQRRFPARRAGLCSTRPQGRRRIPPEAFPESRDIKDSLNKICSFSSLLQRLISRSPAQRLFYSSQ